jgi:hypothetical protein
VRTVPLCLIIIEPAEALSPSVIFTPRYFGFESLPFLVVPPDFLVAILCVKLSPMSIKETLEKIKPFYTLFIILFVAIIFFSLGRLSVENSQKTAINIAYIPQNQTATVINSTSTAKTTSISKNVYPLEIQEDGPVIGSKSGKKYYFPWCGTVKRIKPENQVRFGSIVEAKQAGFIPGGNCKGLY